MADELKGDSFTKEDMLRIYRDMEYIREFESMLKSVRLTKAYNGVEYTYTGPAHLYTGEESAAVGQSYLLDSNDFIFGTHQGSVRHPEDERPGVAGGHGNHLRRQAL